MAEARPAWIQALGFSAALPHPSPYHLSPLQEDDTMAFEMSWAPLEPCFPLPDTTAIVKDQVPNSLLSLAKFSAMGMDIEGAPYPVTAAGWALSQGPPASWRRQQCLWNVAGPPLVFNSQINFPCVWSARASITKYYRPCSFTTVYFAGPEQGLGGPASGKGPLTSLQIPTPLLHPQMVEREPECSGVSFL